MTKTFVYPLEYSILCFSSSTNTAPNKAPAEDMASSVASFVFNQQATP